VLAVPSTSVIRSAETSARGMTMIIITAIITLMRICMR
jgi:hypothetical protein